VEIARVESIAELPGERVALVADPSPPAQSLAGLAGPVTLLVGAEREGLPPDVVSGMRAHGAHTDRASDSLNAAMAATVALYEMTRRGSDGPGVI
jgi:TrmH family RNA methyltransferase